MGLAFTYTRPTTIPSHTPAPPARNSVQPLEDPVFIDPVPDDQTLDCLADLPSPVDLRAVTMDNDTLTITPIDTPPADSIAATVFAAASASRR